METQDCKPSYRILTPGQIDHLHRATLQLLEEVGVKVMLPEAVALLTGAGCAVVDGDVVRIPPELVETAIDSAPSRIDIFNRSGSKSMVLEKRRSYFGLGTDLPHTWDLNEERLGHSQLEDIVNAAIIADALDEIDFIASYALPHNTQASLMYIDSFRHLIENSVKPVFFTAAANQDLAVMHAMAEAAAGGRERFLSRPFIIHYAEPLSPMAHSKGALEKLFYCADNRIPVTYTSGMMSGATAPTPLAGAIVQGNAEALSGLVMHQLRRKGSPIISGFGTATIDMRSAACIYGCPEYRLAISACADLYHNYQIPMWGTAGASDAHQLDQQAAMEWAISLLTAGLDGANLVHDVGYLGQGLVGHPAAIVMCAEIISYVKRLLKGFSIDADHLNLDVFRQVGPMGHYITTKQTLKFFRSEHWQPQLLNRKTLEQWQNAAPDTWKDRAIAKAKALLADHRPEPVDTSVLEQIASLREAAAQKLAHTSFST